MTNEVATQDPRRREMAVVHDPIPVLDSERFAHMQRIAVAMASGSLVPQSLTHHKPEGAKDPIPLPHETIVANCFMVVNQAVRWMLDPFAVAQCVSVVHGKLCYEGKLIAAVLDAKLGVQLTYAWDDKPGDALGIIVTGVLPDGRVETVTGTVGEWKTSGNNSPWGKPSNHKKMLAYRGSREWARLHSPGILLGIYSDDELADLADDARARRAVPITSGLAARLGAASSGGGFSATGIQRELGGNASAVATADEPVVETTEPEATDAGDAAETTVIDDQESPDTSTPPEETASSNSESTQESGGGADVGMGSSVADTEGDVGSDAGATASPDVTAPSSEQAPAADFGAYSRALHRASQEPSLKKYHDSFRENGGGWVEHAAHIATCRLIFGVHKRRVAKSINAGDLLAELKKLGAA